MRQLIYNLRSIVWVAYIAVALLVAAAAVSLLLPALWALGLVLALGSVTFAILTLRA